jgi:hypothetical protein
MERMGCRRPTPRDRAAWLELLETTGTTDLRVHPELADLASDETPLVYTDSVADERTPRTLGVLAPKRVRVTRTPGVRKLATLDGLRLVGDQLVGGCGDGEVTRFLRTILDLLARREADCLYVEDLDVATPLWAGLERLVREDEAHLFHPYRSQPHWWIRFPDDPERYFAKLGSKTRNTLRRKAKKLEHTLVRVTARDDVADYLTRAQQVSATSWQGKRLGLRVAGDERERRFFERVADRGALRSYLLEHRGEPIAFLTGLQWRGRFILDETGFDARHAAASPGTVLLYRVLRDLAAQDCPQWLDFGAGDADYKRRFGNVATRSGPALLVPKTLRPALIMRFGQACRAADDGARSLLRRSGLHGRARRLYRWAGSSSRPRPARARPTRDRPRGPAAAPSR